MFADLFLVDLLCAVSFCLLSLSLWLERERESFESLVFVVMVSLSDELAFIVRSPSVFVGLDLVSRFAVLFSLLMTLTSHLWHLACVLYDFTDFLARSLFQAIGSV